MFYFDFANYFRMLGLAARERSWQARAFYLAVLLLWVPPVALFHAICFALDRLLFPDLDRIDVKAPVFMVGHARSGTTLTHRLMSEDEGRFSSFLLWECYFPSLLQKKVIRGAARADERWLGGALGRLAARYEDWRYGRSRHIHEMSLTSPEEDDIALYYSMASGFWMTKMPWMGELDFYRMPEWPERKRRRIHAFYRELVKRQLHLNGPGKTHLAKNPLWSGRVGCLIEAFPDARFVVNVRDPRETIPSLLKLLAGAWKRLGWDAERRRHSLEVMVAISWDTYRQPLEALDAAPDTRSAIVDYRELTRDPAASIERVYQDLGLPITDAYRAHLARLGQRERRHAGRFEYSLEEFGLEKDAIETELAPLFERFRWAEGEG